MSGAVAGLLGVALGGVITVVARWFFESRRERSEMRAGLRLVLQDLVDALGAVKRAQGATRWPQGANKDWLGAWQNYRPVLALRLSAEDFDAASAAYARMDELQSGLNTGRSYEDRSLEAVDNDDPKVSKRKQNDARFLDQMEKLLSPAVEGLRRLERAKSRQ